MKGLAKEKNGVSLVHRNDVFRGIPAMDPILLEVIAPMVSGTEMSCRGCGLILETTGVREKYRNACSDEYPEDWKMASKTLAGLVQSVSKLYRHRVHIRLIDAQSPVGLWKQIRHRVFRFPAFVVDQKKTYIGWDSEELESLIDARIRGVGKPLL